MKRSVLLAALLVCCCALLLTVTETTEAARLGGGRSFGRQAVYEHTRTRPVLKPPQADRARPLTRTGHSSNSPLPALPGPPFRRHGRLMGGLLAGTLIGSLLSGHGFAGRAALWISSFSACSSILV